MLSVGGRDQRLRVLLRRCEQGDAGAMTEFVDLTLDSVWRLAAMVSADPDAAEGVVRDVYRQLWRDPRSLVCDPAGPLPGLLRRVSTQARGSGVGIA